MRFAILLALVACSPEDPCAKYDAGICGNTEGCQDFTAIELGEQSGGWCLPSGGVAAAEACMSVSEEDCEAGNHYASPVDADGEPTSCFAYTGCEPPLGWIDCDPQPDAAIGECT